MASATSEDLVLSRGFPALAGIHELASPIAFAVAKHVLKPGWALRLRLADIVADVRGFTFRPI